MHISSFYTKKESALYAAADPPNSERNTSAYSTPGFVSGTRPDTGSTIGEVILFFSGNAASLQAAFADLTFTFLLSNYAIVRLPIDAIDSLAAFPQVIYIERPHRLYYEVLAAKRASCITPVQPSSDSRSAPAPASQIRQQSAQNLTGNGTLLCVIDSGIDYTHPDFRNADGSTRLVALWDQTIAPDPDRGFFSPDGYALGTLFTEKQINEALSAPNDAARMQICPSIDASGHGTHVTGIAAGNGRASGGINRGVAYEAMLLIIKLGTPDPLGFPSTTQLMQAVDYATRYASARQLPLVVNLSFGNTYGSHSGTSLLETYLDSVAELARISLAVGSGNEGSSAGHTGGHLRSGETRTLEFAIADYERALSIQIWKNYWDEIDIVLRAPGSTLTDSIASQNPSGNTLTDSSSPPDRLENMNQIFLPTQPGSWGYRIENTALLTYVGQPSPYNIYQEIYLDFLPTDQYLTSGIWSLTLSAGDVTNGIYDLWMPASASRGLDTRFLTPTPEITLTIPSTAARVITVGAYDSRSNTYAPFSGRGFTWNTNQVKPDLVAPGVDILSTSTGGGYESRSGTSMATPFVAGSSCLLMEWGIVLGNDPYLYGQKMKAYLIRGAKHLPFITEYPDPRVGWGTLCVADSIPT